MSAEASEWVFVCAAQNVKKGIQNIKMIYSVMEEPMCFDSKILHRVGRQVGVPYNSNQVAT